MGATAAAAENFAVFAKLSRDVEMHEFPGTVCCTESLTALQLDWETLKRETEFLFKAVPNTYGSANQEGEEAHRELVMFASFSLI